MASEKKTQDKTQRISFKLGSSKRKKRRIYRPDLTGLLKIFGMACVFAVAWVSIYFAEKYIKSSRPVETGTLELVDVPQWASDELKEKICDASGSKIFTLDEEASAMVAENLASIAWLDDIKIQTTNKLVLVKARWRKPMAIVKSGSQDFYVDNELVVLDFVPMPDLPLVKIEGLSSRIPSPGEVWQSDDLNAAVTILVKLDQMDKSVSPGKPLLNEIDRIDVSNFNGRKNNRLPHIVLYAKDNTEIIWGAEFGTWQRYLETTDEEKLAKLYTYFKEHGSLSGEVKYINLRDPQDNIPQPVDKY